MGNDNGGSFVTGFLLGGIIGAVVGLILAPKISEKSNFDLLGTREEWRDRVEELAAKITESLSPKIDVLREQVQPITEKMASSAPASQFEPEIMPGVGMDDESDEAWEDRIEERISS